MKLLLTGNTCFKIANFREGLVRTLLAQGHEVLVLAPADAYRPKLEAMGCQVHDLPMDRNGTSPLAELRLLARIYGFLRHERPDFVFSYTIKNNIYSGLACRWLAIPFAPNVTGLGPAFNGVGLFNRGIRLLYRVAFARARMVFFQNTEDQATFLWARLISADRSRLLSGSGVDLSHFSASALPSCNQGIVFLLVARLLWDKGVGLFVDAARVLRARDPSLRFLILGPIDSASRSGVSYEKMQDWINEGDIEYLGEESDVRPALEGTHCLVLPTWYHEGMPRVLMEAAAIGRPAITTDTPGCRDAVIEGETGLLCAPRSLKSLIAALELFILMSPHARTEMAANAREHAEAEFDERRVVQAYISLLPC